MTARTLRLRAPMAGFRMLVDVGIIFLGVLKLIWKPHDISPIFRAGTFRNHRSFSLALDSLRANPKVLPLIRERYLAPAPYDLEVLARLPEGSLGRTFADHMRKYKLDVVFYPPMEDKVDDDITYVRNRARQTHDIWHVVCGFPAEPIGEMAISAFYLAQHRIPLSALLIGTGFFYTILREPARIDELVETVIRGWGMGKKAESLFSVKWEEFWDEPISHLRSRLGVDLEGVKV